MVNRDVAIGIGILIVAVLGFMFLSNMTGSVITGSVVDSEKIENEYFEIDNSDNQLKEENLNGTQNNSGQK